MDFTKIFEGLDIAEMAKQSIKKAQAERAKRADVKAANAYIQWLEKLNADIEKTKQEVRR